MVLDKVLVPGRPASLDNSRTRAHIASGRCGWGVWTFFFSSVFSLFFLPLWETAQYRLKYCLKGPLNPLRDVSSKYNCYVLSDACCLSKHLYEG